MSRREPVRSTPPPVNKKERMVAQAGRSSRLARSGLSVLTREPSSVAFFLGLRCHSVLARMTISFSCEPFSVIRCNAIEVLKQLQTEADCVITSPPYYLQRSYGTSTNELGREASVAEYISDLVDVFQGNSTQPVGLTKQWSPHSDWYTT
jgi:hypothetical protein